MYVRMYVCIYVQLEYCGSVCCRQSAVRFLWYELLRQETSPAKERVERVERQDMEYRIRKNGPDARTRPQSCSSMEHLARL